LWINDRLACIKVDGEEAEISKEGAMNLYDQLVKMGSVRKELRPHIRPVLATLRRQKMASEERAKEAAGESLFETLAEFCNELAKVGQKILRRESEVVSHRVNEVEHYLEVTHKASRTRYRARFGVDACDLDNVLVVVEYMAGDEVLERDEFTGEMEPTDVAEQAADRLMAVIMGA
jgi:hypothetical protein